MTESNFNLILFWSSLAVLLYTYIGYPLLMCLLALFSRRRTRASQAVEPPTVSVVLAAYNEQDRIQARLRNLIESRYPPDKIEIVVVSDGSTDHTVENISSLSDLRIRVIEQKQRSGKASCLNAGAAAARGDVIVFADTRQQFAPETIARLASHFADSEIGAVSGELMIDPSSSNAGAGVDVYWKLEKCIRKNESVVDSCIGCTGAVYAIRRALYEPLTPDTILDDVVIPMRIAGRGFRVHFEPGALAFDPQALEPGHESIRKRRTLGGNFQMLARHPGWLLPWKNRLWWQLLSHKYLRLIAPLLLLLLFLANALLFRSSPVYALMFFLQLSFYTFAFAGMILPSRRFLLFAIPAGFVFLNVMTVRGLIFFLRNEHHGGWQIARAETSRV